MSRALVDEVVRGVAVRCYARRAGSVVQVLDEALTSSAERVLLVDPALDLNVPYAGFAALVEGAAAGLRGAGAAPGDRVAYLARNGLECAVAIWACARAGLISVGLPVSAGPGRLRDLVELVRPRLLLAADDLAPGLRSATGRPVDDLGLLLAAERPWRRGGPYPDQDDTYALIATSGTTGRPKAVRVTGRMTGHAAEFYVDALALGPADGTPVHLPFPWVSGHVTQLTPAMRSGGSVVTMASFTAAELGRTVERYGVTWLDVVPAVWELLLRAGVELPGVRLAVFGGAPAPPGTLDRVRARWPDLALHDVYALSETCAPVTHLNDEDGRARPGTVGRAVPYADLRLGPDGELQVRSPTVTPGYWGADPPPVTPDGWLATGDLAEVDEAGFVRIVGRASELILRGGVNVRPAEVEAALLSTGLLADAAVVGLPSALQGEAVAALVVARPGVTADVAVLRRAVAAGVGRHAVPRPLRVAGSVPRNPNGKVDRAAVVRLLGQEPGR